MFEHRTENVLSTVQFVRRMARFVGLALLMLAGALLIGVFGYHYLGGFPWLDALLNASMILTGMGPIGEIHSMAGKLFASAYALFSGLVFITIMGVMLAPIMHRVRPT